MWAEQDENGRRHWELHQDELRRMREGQREEENEAWIAAPERKRYLRVLYVTVALSLLLFCVVQLAPFFDPAPGRVWVNGDRLELITPRLIVQGLIGLLAALTILAKYTTARHDFVARHRLDKQKFELSQREKNLPQLDLASLWQITHERLDLYHEIATGQAEKSYRNSRIATVTGFVVLVFAVVLATLSPTTTGAVAAAAAGVAGGALAAYLGRTFLRASEASATQLQSYFAQPLTFSRYLAAERLLDTLEPTDRAGATRDLIQQMAKVTESGPAPQDEAGEEAQPGR